MKRDRLYEFKKQISSNIEEFVSFTVHALAMEAQIPEDEAIEIVLELLEDFLEEQE